MAKPSTLDILQDLLGQNDAVDFETFCSSPEFCNNPNIYKYWYEKEKQFPEKLCELIIDGSIGGGKSYFSSYYFAYRVYKLFQAGSLQSQLGVPEDTDIFGLYFSVSLKIAQKSGFQTLYSIFKDCKWFQDNCPIDTKLTSSIKFIGKHFQIDAASDFSHQIGLNVWGFILDEANFRGGVGSGLASEYSEVTELYQQLLDRQISRFSCSDGSVNALAMLISSASYNSSFTEKRVQAVKLNPYASHVTVRKYEVTPERYSKDKFEVFVGCGAIEPCLVESHDHKLKLIQMAQMDEETAKGFFMNVPVNLLPQFKSNCELAVQNHCGVSTSGSSSFLPNLKILYDSWHPYVKPPFQSEKLTASTGDDTELQDYWLDDMVQYRDRPHSVFLDLSIAHDTCAICCYRYDGKNDKEEDMHTRVFSLRVIPPPFPYQTRIEKIKRFILFLAEHVNLVAFASDQYQSENLRQEVCDELGLPNVRVSIDSSDAPHLHWRSALAAHRIRQAKDTHLEEEVRTSIWNADKHRVVKANGSSDDILQANVGAFFLSDTVGKGEPSAENWGGTHQTVFGTASFRKMLKTLGYK